MTLERGQQLLHYRLTEKIGEGGMGEVWRAVDTTLDRAVLTADGHAKVLDFGLAKAAEPDASSSSVSPSLSPTLTSAGTVAGVLLGTAAYMSPEQARGKPVDRRADLWALGCVIYESLTGNQLFRGETISDSLAAVLRKEPDWSTLPHSTPPMARSVAEADATLRRPPDCRSTAGPTSGPSVSSCSRCSPERWRNHPGLRPAHPLGRRRAVYISA